MIEPIIQKKPKRQPQDGITPYMLISTCSSVDQHRFMKAVDQHRFMKAVSPNSQQKGNEKESQT
jgi:hypothetical protein